MECDGESVSSFTVQYCLSRKLTPFSGPDLLYPKNTTYHASYSNTAAPDTYGSTDWSGILTPIGSAKQLGKWRDDALRSRFLEVTARWVLGDLRHRSRIVVCFLPGFHLEHARFRPFDRRSYDLFPHHRVNPETRYA